VGQRQKSLHRIRSSAPARPAGTRAGPRPRGSAPSRASTDRSGRSS